MTPPRHIVLVGLMGTGKTTLGRLLGEQLGRPFRDGDALLEAQTGRTAARLKDELGEDGLHALEAETLLRALDEDDPSVIAAAASTIESPACRTRLTASDVACVWLRGSPALLARRFASGPHRPAFGRDVEAFVRDQAARRDPLYASIRPLAIDVDGREPGDLVSEIIRRLQAASGHGPSAGGR